MKLKLFIIFSLFFYSCDKETDSNPFVSGNENLNDDYSINLDWDDNYSMNKTSVNIKWNQWFPNDSTQFIKYIIKDVTNTENVKTLENITNVSDIVKILNTMEINPFLVKKDIFNLEISFTFTRLCSHINNIDIILKPIQ